MKTTLSHSFTLSISPLQSIGVDRFRLLFNGWYLKLLSLLLVVIVGGNLLGQVSITSYYSKSTGNLNDVANWGTATDGSGSAPSNFTANNQVFNIRNNTSPTIGAAWTVSGSNSKIIVGDGTNACNFTIPSNNAVTGTVDVSANATLTITNSSFPTFGTLHTTSTVVFNASVAQTIPIATYGNLTYSGSNVGTLGGSMTIGRDLSVTNGKLVINNGTSYQLTIQRNLSISGTNAKIDLNSGGSGTSIINLAGNLDVSGTGNAIITDGNVLNGKIVFNGVNQSYSNTSSVNNGGVNFTINNGSTLSLLNSLSLYRSTNPLFQGTVTISNGGTLIASTSNIIIGNGSSGTAIVTIEAGGTFSTSNAGGIEGTGSSGSNGTIATAAITRTYSAGAHYVFNGATTTPFPTTGLGNPGNLTFNAAVTINTPITISGIITNNGTLTIPNGVSLVQTGTGTNSGGGAYNVKQNITGAGSGTPTGRYWYVGSPVSGATSAVYNASGANILKYYSEPANAWQEITDNTSALEVGRGYFVQAASGTSELNFTGGTINNGSYTLNVTRNTSTNAYRGYNLLTNPYPSYLDWDNVTRNQVGTTIWYRSVNNAGTMVFDTYNAPAGTGTNNNQAGAVTRYIPPMQSFWVSVPQGQTSGTVSFGNAQRSHYSTGVQGLRSSAQDFPAFLRLNLLDGNFVDQTILYMKPDANNTFDEYDSEKMFLGGVPQFYSTVNAKKLVLNGMKNQKARTSVPLTMELPTSKSYTFQAEEFNIEDGLILLEDKQEGVIQDLTINPTYSFFGNAGTNATRFVVHFQLANAPILVGGPQELENLGMDQLSTENIQITSNNQGTVIIRLDEGFKPEGSIRIFDASGRLVEQTDFNDQETTKHLNEQAGMYFVEVAAGKLMVKKKIVIE